MSFCEAADTGTAVAIMVGFQNNATHDRLWEAGRFMGR